MALQPAPRFEGFSQVAHQLEQEKLEARRLAQAAQAQRQSVQLRQQQLWQQGAIASAQMQQQQGQFEAGMAMDERRAGLSEIQEARRQFEAVQEGEFRKQQEARRAQMDELRFKANQLEGIKRRGVWVNPATGQTESAFGPGAPEWARKLAQEGVDEREQEKQRAAAEEKRKDKRVGLLEAAEQRRLLQTFEGSEFNLPFGLGTARIGEREKTPQEKAQEQVDYRMGLYRSLVQQGIPDEEAKVRSGLISRPRMATAPAEKIRAKRTAVSTQIAKVAKLKEELAQQKAGPKGPGGEAPDTKVLDELLEIAETNLREERAELAEMQGGEIEQPAPLGRQELPTEASMDLEAERLGIQRPGQTGATPPPSLDKMTYEWLYEQVLPQDLAGKYAGTGAIPTIRGLWGHMKSGTLAGDEAAQLYSSLPPELMRTFYYELRRLNLVPKAQAR